MLDVMASLLTYQAGLYFGTPAAGPRGAATSIRRSCRTRSSRRRTRTSRWASPTTRCGSACCRALGATGARSKDPRFDTEANRVTNRDDAGAAARTRSSARAPRTSGSRGSRRRGVPAGRIKSVAEVCESEHLKARGMMVSLPHPQGGADHRDGRADPPARHAGRGHAAAAAARPAHRGGPAKPARPHQGPPSSDFARKASSDALTCRRLSRR